jgi:hypothetical protein
MFEDQPSAGSENRPPARSAEERRVWGAPVAPRTAQADPIVDAAAENGSTGSRMSTLAKSLTAVGVAAVIASGGTIAVTSAAASDATSNQSGQAIPYGPDAPGAPWHGESGGPAGAFPGGPRLSGIGGTLHGEFVVADGTGTLVRRVQTGTVTAISSTRISVKSSDGFTATYAVQSGLDVTSISSGTTVRVVATVSGNSVTATSINTARTPGAAGELPGTAGGTGRPGGGGPGQRGSAGTGRSGSYSVKPTV